MNTLTAPSTAEDFDSLETTGTRRPRRRGRRLTGIVLVVLVVAAGVVAITDPFGSGGTSNSGNAAATSLVTVTQRELSSQTNVNGTLGYAGSSSVVNQAQGTITALPAVGQIVNQGQVLYRVNGNPVVLLFGSIPAYRALALGTSGADVAALNADLVALGYATSSQLDPASDDFGRATVTALKKLQSDLGVTTTGSLALGDAVFLPAAIRITEVSATLGSPAQPGGPVLTATSTTRVVTISLDAAQQSQIKVGDQVTITLPNNTTTPGVVWSVGSVATAKSENAAPSIDVVVIPSDATATGTLDQAPVQVSIITDTVKNALVVPVDALLALAGGGYAVETVNDHGAHELEPVTLGLFDDAQGLVQISGAGVAAGQRVVVPST